LEGIEKEVTIQATLGKQTCHETRCVIASEIIDKGGE